MDISLDGRWGFVVDPDNHGIVQQWYMGEWISRHIANSPKITVPSNFNLQPGLDRYIGAVWYILRLPEIPYRPKSHEYSIEFEGSNYITEVWLNSIKLGRHEGGYLPFRMQFSPRLLSLTGENYLAVRVDAG
ncbi:MAG: sugar-binding domain-containing protein, partial [Promethearchaeota archaeon]